MKRFPALRYRDFRILWLGMVFASGTLAFQYYAQMWLIYSITESAWVLGILGAIRGLATLVFGLYGGVLADRMDRRKLLIITAAIAFGLSILLGMVAISGVGNIWVIFLLIFAGAATGSIDGPIRQALVPELIPAEHIPNAVALTSAAQMGSFAITPVLAGFVIDSVGPGGAYLLSALGNLALLVALVRLNYRGSPRKKGGEKSEPVLSSLQTGFSFSRRQPIILWIMSLNFVTAALCFSLYLGLIAKWAGSVLHLSPGEYGWLAATWGVGTLVASYTLSWVGEISRPGRLVVLGAILFSSTFAIFGLTRSLPLIGLIFLINGGAWTAANIASVSIIQRIVPNLVRGRVMSVFMLNMAFAQMNSLVLGLVADLVTMEIMVPVATGLCTMLVVLLILAVPTLRNLDSVIDRHREKSASL